MAKSPKPFTIIRRTDSKSYRLTLNQPCGLPEPVCGGWFRRSFQHLPDELANHRNPKTRVAEEAAAFALIQHLKKKQDVQQAPVLDTSVGDFAKDMFTQGAPHLKRWTEKGFILKPQTISQHRRHLVNYLLPGFGKTPLDKIRPAKVEDFLLEQKLSNSSRNGILNTLELIMQEAKREGVIDMVPELEPFKRSSKRQNVLSSEELAALFPASERELISVWKRPDDMRKEREEIALMFGTLFCVAVSAGMRSGEIRAMFAEQVSLVNSGLVIDRAVDELGVIGLLKKGTEEDPRSRAVLIPDKSLKILERWLDRTPKCPDYPGLVFPYRNKLVSAGYILDSFRFGLDNLGIDYEKRRLTVHCLRYTYNTRMKTKLPGDVLREFLGHRSVEMTDHYDNPILLERLLALQEMRSVYRSRPPFKIKLFA